MLKWMRCAQVVGLILLLVACGDTHTNPNPIPTPTPIDPGAPTPLPTPPPNVDTRIPDLSLAVPVALSDRAGLSALKDMAHNVFAPLVGDPLLHIQFSRTREVNVSGKLLFSFEDQFGFWGAELSSFTGVQTNQQIDIIFADDELVIRAAAERTGDDLNGLIFYRLRRPFDTACRKTWTSCEVSGYPFFNFPAQCFQTPDTTASCREYMNLADSAVKSIGSFQAKYSQWATIQESP